MPRHQAADESSDQPSLRRRKISTRSQIRSQNVDTKDATASSLPTLSAESRNVKSRPVSRSVPSLNSPDDDVPSHSYGLRSTQGRTGPLAQLPEVAGSPSLEPSGSRNSPRGSDPPSPSPSESSGRRSPSPEDAPNVPVDVSERDQPSDEQDIAVQMPFEPFDLVREEPRRVVCDGFCLHASFCCGIFVILLLYCLVSHFGLDKWHARKHKLIPIEPMTNSTTVINYVTADFVSKNPMQRIKNVPNKKEIKTTPAIPEVFVSKQKPPMTKVKIYSNMTPIMIVSGNQEVRKIFSTTPKTIALNTTE